MARPCISLPTVGPLMVGPGMIWVRSYPTVRKSNVARPFWIRSIPSTSLEALGFLKSFIRNSIVDS